MAREEYFSQLSLIMMKLCLQSYTFCFYFILFLPLWIRIRFWNTDPQSLLRTDPCWIRIHNTAHNTSRDDGGDPLPYPMKEYNKILTRQKLYIGVFWVGCFVEATRGCGSAFWGSTPHPTNSPRLPLCGCPDEGMCGLQGVLDFWPRGAWLSPPPPGSVVYGPKKCAYQVRGLQVCLGKWFAAWMLTH